jgi:hypothetical protein
MGYLERWLSYTAPTASGSCYTLDHEPAHVHITGVGQAKINLLGADSKPEMIQSIGIKRADIRRLMDQAAEHQAHFLAEWEKIHGSKD